MHVDAEPATLDDLPLCVLLDFLSLQPHSLEVWFRDPRYVNWVQGRTPSQLPNHVRADPQLYPPLAPVDILAIELAHALLVLRSTRFIRLLLRRGWALASETPLASAAFVRAAFRSLSGTEAEALSCFRDL